MAKIELKKTMRYVISSINEVSFKALIDSGANQCLGTKKLVIKLWLAHSKELDRLRLSIILFDQFTELLGTCLSKLGHNITR